MTTSDKTTSDLVSSRIIPMNQAHPPTPQVRLLNARQRRFAQEYATCGVAAEAARRAGYRGAADRIGQRLLRNVEVRAEIARISAPAQASRLASADEILTYLASVMRDQAVVHRDRIRAAELIGKRHALWVERSEHGGPGGGPIPSVMSTLSIDELRSIIELAKARRVASHHSNP